MKRKQSVMVELTFTNKIKDKDAVRFIRRLLDGDALDQVIYEESIRNNAEIIKFSVKEGDRVLRANEKKADALIEAEKRGAERMRERAADVAGQRSAKLSHQDDLTRGYACGRSDAAYTIRALPLTEETPDADA